MTLIVVAACALPLTATAQEAVPFTASVYGSVERSANAEQQRGGDSSTIKRLGLNADLSRDTRRMDYGLNGDASWADYSGSLPSTLHGSLTGYLNLGAPDAILNWNTSDSIRQSRLLSSGNNGPNNSEFVNSFSTGPVLRFRLGDVNQLTLNGRYSRTSYENSPFDSEGLRASAGFAHSMAGGSSVGLNVAATGTSYISNAINAPGNDSREAYLSYSSDPRRRSTLSLDAGYTETRSAGVSDSSPLLRLALRRQISGISAIFLTANRHYTNPADLQPVASDSSGGYTPVSAIGAVKSTSINGGWTATGRRTTLSFNTGWRKEEYQAAPQLDSRGVNFGFGLHRQLRSTLSASLDASYRIEELEDPAVPKYHTLNAGFSLNKQIGRRISAGIGTSYTQRSDDAFTINEYSEWRYGANISYLLTRPGD